MKSHSYLLGGEERKEEEGEKGDSLEVGVKVVSLEWGSWGFLRCAEVEMWKVCAK